MDSPLRGKPLYCREWVVQKLLYIANPHQQSIGRLAKKNGYIILGSAGCGKTALLSEISWPTSNHAKQHSLSRRVIARHFCQAHFWHSLSVISFVSSLIKQLKCSSHFPTFKDVIKDLHTKDEYSPFAIRSNPDKVFQNVFLSTLSLLNPQGNLFFLVVDSVDEDYETQLLSGDRILGNSKTIADLLLNNLENFPPWLILLCSARRSNHTFVQRFAGFRKIILDDQEKRKQYVQKDIKGYICNRIECDNKLKVFFSNPETRDVNIELLENKSDRCILYLEWVLDGVQSGLIKFSEIKEIPGTLRGLYLWICQHLFERKTFSLIRPIFNVLLATRSSITETDVVDYLWSRNLQVSQDELYSRLKLIERFLTRLPDGSFRLFHTSFSEWLLDVKYCTRHFLCDINQGHATLALSATCNLDNKPFDEEFVLDFAYDLARSVPCHKYSNELCALWMAWSGLNTENVLNSFNVPPGSYSGNVNVFRILLAGGACRGSQNIGTSEISDHMTSTISVDLSDSRETESEHAVRVMLDNNPSCIAEHDSDGFTPLAKAAQRGSLSCVKVLIKAGSDVNAENVNRQTAIGLASAAGHTNVVNFLLQNGANVNHKDADNLAALRSAAQHGHADIVDLLLQYGADVDSVDNNGKTALRLAAFGGYMQPVQRLISAGADVNSQDSLGRTALIASSYGGHVDIVELLLENGAEIDHLDSAGHSAIVFAFLNSQHDRHLETVNILLQYEAKVDYVDGDGMSPLGIAASQGHSRIVELLLNKGNANAQFADTLGRTALYHAVHSGQANTVLALINWGAQQDVIDCEGRSLLSLACLQGHVEVAQLLIEHSLDENHKDDHGSTPLHLATAEGSVDTCCLLVEAGARINELDNEGKTPLIYAAENGNLSAAKWLVEAGADVKHTAHNGFDAIRFAALEERISLVDFFMSIGCDFETKDSEGRTVLYFLAQDNKVTMVKQLIDRGAHVNSVDNNGRSALIVAAWVGHVDMCQLLLENGADVHQADNEGLTGLLMAAWENRKDVIELMLNYGADIEHSCNQGATALVIAVQEGHMDTVRLLLHYQADPKHEDEHGRNPMRIAMKNNHHEIIQLLEAYGSLPIHDVVSHNLSPTKKGSLDGGSSVANNGLYFRQGKAPVAPALPSRHPSCAVADSQQRSSRFMNSLSSNKNTMRSEHRQSAALSISSDHFSCHSLGANEQQNAGFNAMNNSIDANAAASVSSSANSSLDKRVHHSDQVIATEEQIYNHYDEPCSVEHTNTIGYNQTSSHQCSIGVTTSSKPPPLPINSTSPMCDQNTEYLTVQYNQQNCATLAPMSSGYDPQFGEHASEDAAQSLLQPHSSCMHLHNSQLLNSQDATNYLQMSILEQAWKHEQESREKQMLKKQKRLSVFGKISKVFRLSGSSNSNTKYKHPLFNLDMPPSEETLNAQEPLKVRTSTGGCLSNPSSPHCFPISTGDGSFFASSAQQHPTPSNQRVVIADGVKQLQSAINASNVPPHSLDAAAISRQNPHIFESSSKPQTPLMNHARSHDYMQFSNINSQSNTSFPHSQQQQVNQGADPNMRPKASPLENMNSSSSSGIKKSDYMRLVDLTHLQSYDHQSQMSNRIANYERKPQMRKSSLEFPPHPNSNEELMRMQVNMDPSLGQLFHQGYHQKSVPLYVTTPSVPLPRRPPPPVPTEPQLSYQKRAPPPLPRRPRKNENLFLHTGGLSKSVPPDPSTPKQTDSQSSSSSQNSQQMNFRSNYINHGEAAKRAALCRKPKLETIVEPESSTGDFSKLSIAARASITASPATSTNRRTKVETVI